MKKLRSAMKIIGIVGTRRRTSITNDYKLILDAFKSVYEDGDIICSGGCPEGADSFAKQLHKNGRIPYLEFPANWEKHGKAAGFIRNTDIAKWSHVLIACVAEDRTGGTEDTISKFQKFHPDGKLILV